MKVKGRRFYYILLFVFAAGYAWLGIKYFYSNLFSETYYSTCIIKHITGIPCPSCGTTRSLSLLLHGDVAAAAYLNPLGILSGFILIIIPVWLLFDLIANKYSFTKAYNNAEQFFKNRQIAIVSVTMIVVNWIWNITKGL